MSINIERELKNAITGEISGSGVVADKSIGFYAAALQSELITHISGADMPGGVKNALINSISVAVLDAQRAVVHISAPRMSIYENGSADLALVYNQRRRIKRSAIYFNKEKNIYIPIGRLESWARPYSNNYLENTASDFMGAYPECTVTLSK